jgi:hypothetical protein
MFKNPAAVVPTFVTPDPYADTLTTRANNTGIHRIRSFISALLLKITNYK